jgi:hypothetical protein
VLAGIFTIHDGPIFLLFDFRATHNFISMACVERLHLTLTALNITYLITSPDVRINTTYGVMFAPLDLEELIYPTHLSPGRTRY